MNLILLIPLWFYGFDSAMYLISSLVGFLISFNSYKLYSISHDKSHLYLHLGFILLSLGLLLVGIVSAYSYYVFKICQTNCQLSLFDSVFGIEDFGLLVYFGLSIFGYSLLTLSHLPKNTKISALILLFILAFSSALILVGIPPSELLLWYTYHQYFNLMAIIIVGYIFFKVSSSFSEQRNLCSSLVVLGFGGILAFHIFNFFSFANPWSYAIAHLFLLTGYLSLLVMLNQTKCQ